MRFDIRILLLNDVFFFVMFLLVRLLDILIDHYLLSNLKYYNKKNIYLIFI